MILVTVTSTRGSAPREAGAHMIVADKSVRGTIGGGQLEYMAIDRARVMLRKGEARSDMDIPLGPEIGQCCGGRVTLSLERIAKEPPPDPRPQVLIFGAGHVGRALARALALLPVRPILIDQRIEELQQAQGAECRLTPLPEAEIRDAPLDTSYIIVTHDHALDFLLTTEALKRADSPYIGMIGSDSKHAQFRRFAASQNVDPARLICPIGAGPGGQKTCRDKRPEIIAALTAAELVTRLTARAPTSAPAPIPSSEKHP